MFCFVLFYLIKTAAKVMGEWTGGLLQGSRWVEEGAAPGLLCPGSVVLLAMGCWRYSQGKADGWLWWSDWWQGWPEGRCFVLFSFHSILEIFWNGPRICTAKMAMLNCNVIKVNKSLRFLDRFAYWMISSGIHMHVLGPEQQPEHQLENQAGGGSGVCLPLLRPPALMRRTHFESHCDPPLISPWKSRPTWGWLCKVTFECNIFKGKLSGSMERDKWSRGTITWTIYILVIIIIIIIFSGSITLLPRLSIL